MNDTTKTDREDWEAPDQFANRQALDDMAEKLIAGGGPAVEKMGAELSGQTMPLVKAFLAVNKDDIADLDQILKTDPAARAEYDEMMKGKASNEILKRQVSNFTNMMMTMQIDPDIHRDSVDNYDFPHERVKPVLLRRAGTSAAPQMIKQYRYHQLAEFATASDGKKPGFALEFIDPERKATKKEQDTIAKFQNVFARQFFFVPNEERPSLTKFLCYGYQDFFDLDKIAIETVRQRGSLDKKFDFRGKPLGWVLQDAGTIFHVVPTTNRTNTGVDSWRWDKADYTKALENSGIHMEYIDEIRYIQVDRHKERRAGYTDENMILSHAFGTTNIEEQFQGYSIIEKGLEILRYIVDSIIYNYTRRSTGTMPKGMIAIEGATEDGFSREEMELFRKLIWGMASGRKDHWKYPVLGTPKGVKPSFIKFHDSSKEMEDFLWVSTLFSILCTFAGMSPESISLASQKNTLGKQKLFSKSEEEGAVVRSQDEGLRFFLNYFREIINSSMIVEELTGIEGLQWAFLGLDVEDEGKKKELELQGLATTESMNDLLVAADKKEAELEIAGINIYDLPGSSNDQFIQLITAALQAKQQEQMGMGMFPGEEGDGEGGRDYIGGEQFADPSGGSDLPPGQKASPNGNGKATKQGKERRSGNENLNKAIVAITILNDEDDEEENEVRTPDTSPTNIR